jgi:hypothetical protein
MVRVTSDPEEQSGTGEPRSARGPTAQAERGTDRQGSGRAEEAVDRGAARGSQPALDEELHPNRSGSGGSGGPATGDAPGEQEGSGSHSMEEMLGGTSESRASP